MALRNTMIILLSCLSLSAPALAQPAKGDSPIDITADKTLEWHREKKQYIAIGNAVITQGDVTIRAAKIIADYRDTPKTGMEIYQLTAIDAVSIDNKGSTASGDHLVYIVDSGLATMTGDDLAMTSPDQTVTATDALEYNTVAGTLKARGQAKVVRASDTLNADEIVATLKNDAEGKQVLDQLDAIGHVKIVTPSETLTGAKGVYRAESNTAEISGGVTITRDQNTLSGDHASVDLTTNISRLFAAENAENTKAGRVHGTFYPTKKTTP